jgi:hypothetical protein
MAQVTVFIDDVVLGRLPSLCVKEGIPTESRLTVRDATSGTGLGFAWLLIFLGPPGWIGLFIMTAIIRGGVTGKLPFCEFAYRRLIILQRMQTVWFVAFGVLGLLALAGALVHRATYAAGAIALGAAAVAALIKAVVETRRLRRAEVHLELDTSGRWVTISGVHPDFAAAVADVSAGSAHSS